MADANRESPPQPLSVDERAAIVTHMNQDHPEALLVYARVLARIVDAQTAVMRSIDTGGMDLEVGCGDETRAVRIAFEQPLKHAGDARRVLIEMVQSARRQLAGEPGSS
jgi:putative heme iron utilization protein